MEKSRDFREAIKHGYVPLFCSSIFIREIEAIELFDDRDRYKLSANQFNVNQSPGYLTITSPYFADLYTASLWLFENLQLGIENGLRLDQLIKPTSVNSYVSIDYSPFMKVELSTHLGKYKPIDDYPLMPADTKMSQWYTLKLENDPEYFGQPFLCNNNFHAQDAAWRNFPFKLEDTDTEVVKKNTNDLLNLCKERKEWTIPEGAIVELGIDKWNYLELYENGREVLFIFRHEFSYFSISYNNKTKEWNEAGLGFIQRSATKEMQNALHAIKYIASMILHDFWVTDYRVRNATLNPEKRSFNHKIGWGKKGSDGRTLVYMPRIKYLFQNENTKASRISQGSSFEVRFRSAHVRDLSKSENLNPSPKQIILAEHYNVLVPEGYTFVRPSKNISDLKGKSKSNEQVYRSRSALQAFNTLELSTKSNSTKVAWQKFEMDIKRYLKEVCGFIIVPRSLQKRGDSGIDVLALKKVGKKYLYFVVQCKCYNRDRKVGIKELRELYASTISTKEIPDRNDVIKIPVMITTSDFSTGIDCQNFSKECEIILVDGEALAKGELIKLTDLV